MRSHELFARHSSVPPPPPAAANRFVPGIFVPFVLVPLVVVFAGLAAMPARADVIRTSTSVIFTGSISNSAGPVSVQATLWYDPGDPDFLNLLLQNTSTTATIAPAGLLTSFYFGVICSGSHPTLTYASGTGQVFKPALSGTGTYGVWTPPSVTGSTGVFTPGPGLSNLKATGKFDETWEFKSTFSVIAPSQPSLTFGIGTTGNGTLSPNNFDGNIVGDVGFGIVVGDGSDPNLVNKDYLVKDSALFRFAGFAGCTADDIQGYSVFGLGSAPDVVVTVPEPAGICLAALGAALGLRVRRRPVVLRSAGTA